MPLVLAILAVLAAALTWMFAAAGLARYRSQPGSGWTELLPAIVVGFVAVLFATLAIVAARVRRQQAEFAARIAQSPDRPWLHVPQWNRGRIQDAPAKQATAALGAFAATFDRTRRSWCFWVSSA